MRFISTRSANEGVSLDQALQQGLAPDGGLYLPETLPRFSLDDFAAARTLQEIAAVLLRPFFSDSSLRAELPTIISETLTFPIPVVALQESSEFVGVLELFHGPTAAFKDVGAAFLGATLSRLHPLDSGPLTILVATSGDTGGAVAAAFNERPNIRVVILFPDQRVSARQAHQLSCWGSNVLSLAVRGSFDDCQSIVKAAFNDSSLASRYTFSSANSINIGRLLPQCSYYAAASIQHWRSTGRAPGYIVPTGNLGNAVACLLVKMMGLPVGPIIFACNENRTIMDYFESGEWLPRASVQTLASAMDVGDPSNMERLRVLLGEKSLHDMDIAVRVVTDNEIQARIRADFAHFSRVHCPHTATASHAYHCLTEKKRKENDWIVVSTAHPAKFEAIVEPLIGQDVTLPQSLSAIENRAADYITIDATLADLKMAMNQAF